MIQLIYLIIGVISLFIGSVLGYYARQSIARKQKGTLEAKIQKQISRAKSQSEKIISDAKAEALKILESTKKEREAESKELGELRRLLLKREKNLERNISKFEEAKGDFEKKLELLKEAKKKIDLAEEQRKAKLEKISHLSKEEARKELLEQVEEDYSQDILERVRKLEQAGIEKYERRAKEILAQAIQKYALSQAQEITTTTLDLPSDEIKGRIIGREGRNIKALEKLTGVEIIVDDTPQMLLISGFNPVRRQIAKLALEKLIRDGRIQPARIEKFVKEAELEIVSQMKKAGEAAARETGVLDLDPKLIKLLGRLHFRTSYGQNVLLHSIEVSHLATALASEIGADIRVCKKAGLLHDIGKALDKEVEGSHVEIGIKILEKFAIEEEIIKAIKSHHEDYPYETLEAILIQVADQISGARPGARKDTLDQYLKRLEDLEEIALSFPGVLKAWALQAGRELRVFVKPEEIDDLTAGKLARDIANEIQRELKYPGEIKVNLIREKRVVEYAK